MQPVTLLQLRAELHATAEALSRKRVRLGFEEIPARFGGGYCVTTKENIFVIGLDPRQSLGDLYQIFLHEVGHAFTAGWELPDRERAAWEIASIWAVWIARRNPNDLSELIVFLRKLRRYHEKNSNDYTFTMGANRGMRLPMATQINTPSNRITNGGQQHG